MWPFYCCRKSSQAMISEFLRKLFRFSYDLIFIRSYFIRYAGIVFAGRIYKLFPRVRLLCFTVLRATALMVLNSTPICRDYCCLVYRHYRGLVFSVMILLCLRVKVLYSFEFCFGLGCHLHTCQYPRQLYLLVLFLQYGMKPSIPAEKIYSCS